jgi:hypothetical protein
MFKHPMKPLLPCVRFWAALFVALTGFTSSHGAEAAATGTITGSVSNAATTNLLEGSRVEIGALGLSTLADNTGRYVLTGVPAGTHEVVVSYLGLDTLRRPVTVGAGERAVQNFDLTTSIYRLEGFKVSGEREGGAAAITAQRNAPNLKNVAAMDSFGNLPNMSASEVAINLPGVAAVPNESGLVTAFTVRGMGPGLNTVTMDGVLLTSRDDGLGRATQINVYASAMFDQIELTKGHTPDRSPDSLGGTINLKSRSPLGMKEKRRITYNLSGRMQPTFTQQVPLIDGHRSHPLVNLGYQEIFDVFGGERNLGVAVNLFYSEHATAWFITNRDFQNTTNTPAYVWDYRTTDTYNPHYQASANVKLEYRLSPTTKLTLNTFAVDNNEKFRRRYETRAFTNQIVGTTGTAGILPGYTDRITQVRATPSSLIDLTMTGPNNVFVRARGFDLGAEQTFGPRLRPRGGANLRPAAARLQGRRQPLQREPRQRQGRRADQSHQQRRLDSRPHAVRSPPALHPDRRPGHHQSRELPPRPQRPHQRECRQRPRGTGAPFQRPLHAAGFRAQGGPEDRRAVARKFRHGQQPRPPLELHRHDRTARGHFVAHV